MFPFNLVSGSHSPWVFRMNPCHMELISNRSSTHFIVAFHGVMAPEFSSPVCFSIQLISCFHIILTCNLISVLSIFYPSLPFIVGYTISVAWNSSAGYGLFCTIAVFTGIHTHEHLHSILQHCSAFSGLTPFPFSLLRFCSLTKYLHNIIHVYTYICIPTYKYAYIHYAFAHSREFWGGLSHTGIHFRLEPVFLSSGTTSTFSECGK